MRFAAVGVQINCMVGKRKRANKSLKCEKYEKSFCHKFKIIAKACPVKQLFFWGKLNGLVKQLQFVFAQPLAMKY